MKSMRNGRRAILARSVAAVALALSLTACGGGTGDKTSSSGKPVNGGSIVVGLEGDADTLLPGAAQLALSPLIEASVIFDPLVKVDTDGNFQPFLAQSLTHNDALTEWTVKLRPGVKFTDGTPLDAKTLKTIFDDYLTAEGATTLAALSDASGNLVKMQVVDNLTVKYILPEANASFPYVLTLDAGWPFSVKAAKAAGKDAGLKPVGTGPYQIKSWTHGESLVVTRNKNYWRKGTTHLDQITFRPINDEDSRLTSFQSGDLDAIMTPRGSTIRKLKEMASSGDANFEMYTGDSAGGTLMNTATPPFDDLRVRKALIEATGFDELSQVMDTAGVSKQATQLFSSDSVWHSDKAAEIYPKYDVADAKKLLDEYRNDPKRSDGQPVGSKVKISYQCQGGDLAILAQGLQSEWNKVGFDTSIQTVEQAAMIGNVVGSPDTKPAWVGDFSTTCWRFSAEPDPGKLVQDFGPADSVLNFSNYENPDLTKALSDFRSTTDLDQRKDAAHRIAEILAEEVPIGYLDETFQGIATQPDVHFDKKMELPDGGVGRPQVSGAVIDWSGLWRSK